MQPEPSDNRVRLCEIIETEYENLLNSLQLYVIRAGISGDRPARAVAADLLGEVAEQALLNADRWNASIRPVAWLLGIANNLIKRRKTEFAKRNRREPLARDLYGQRQFLMSEDEIFDLLAGFGAANPAMGYETEERITELLSPLSESDQRLIRAAILNGLSVDMLAEQAGISTAAARKRLYRALCRLRSVQLAVSEVNKDG